MQKRQLPEHLYRAHVNAEGPLDPSSATGTGRFDDFRVPAHFHVLYTGDSIEGCFIEKLQRYRGSDDKARAILEAIDHEGGFEPVIPGDNVIPADLLRKLAASCLRVLDVTRDIIQVDALQSIMQLRTLGLAAGIGLPELRPADVLQSNYDYSRRLSTIIFETQSNAVGSASRSSLDDPSDTKAMHTNYNLFRATPQNGSGLRLPLERVETNRALDRYRSQLDSAIAFLGAKPALPLDHPDLAVP